MFQSSVPCGLDNHNLRLSPRMERNPSVNFGVMSLRQWVGRLGSAGRKLLGLDFNIFEPDVTIHPTMDLQREFAFRPPRIIGHLGAFHSVHHHH